MTDARTPPHHADWESQSELPSRPHAEPEAPVDGRVRAPWTRVLGLGAAAFAVWFLLFAPTLQHNAQVSPVGTRRTISLDVTGPVAALSRGLQLSHIVSATGRSNRLPGGTVGLITSGPRPTTPPHHSTPGLHDGAERRHDPCRPDDGAAQPEGADRGCAAARADRGRLHRPRPGRALCSPTSPARAWSAPRSTPARARA